MSTDKESSVAGTDNRPPMLVESDYESWKIRIERYIHVQVTRDKTDEEFTEIKNNRELADIQATNILSQGLPRHVFNILNHTRTEKEIWDNLDIPAHQMNTKFVNNLPPYWAKYVTNVNNNKDISETTYVELYTYLKSYEPHALKTLKKQEKSSSIVKPLAYLASTTHHLTPTQPTNPPPSTSSLTLPPQPAAQSSNDAMLATMNQIVNLLSSFQKQFPLTNNQLRTSSNSRSHATVHNGQIVTETIQRKAPGNVGNTCTRGTQSYGQVTDNKGKLVICYNYRRKGHVSRQSPYDQLLAVTTTNNFEVSHEDAYDSDVDEGPHAAAALWPTCHPQVEQMEEHLDSDVESDIDENTILYHQYQLDIEVQNVPTGVSSVSPGEIFMITILDDLRNQLDGHLMVNQDQSMAKIAQATLYDGHALLKPTNTPVRVHDSKESLVQAKVSRTKMSNRPWTIKPINYAELNALYSHFVPQKELSREQVYWLPAEELATQKNNPPKHVTPFVHTCPAPSKEQLQGKDDTIRKLHTQINNMSMLNVEPTVGSFDKQALETELTQLKDAITSDRIQNDGFKVENVNLKRRYQELSKSSSHSRDTLTRKITALTIENAKLKSKTLSKMHSKPIVPEKPKVLAPGMYAISSKYIVPPRRVNRAEPTHLPKKKQATFQEPPRPSNRPIQKTVVQQNKKPNIHVNLSTGVKPATRASKPMSKSATRNH
nr:hypothetical protein [Tanacetum cinerariifolium]